MQGGTRLCYDTITEREKQSIRRQEPETVTGRFFAPVFPEGKEGWPLGRISQRKAEEALRLYFEEGMNEAEIAGRLGVKEQTVGAVLGDPGRLAPYRARSEAAKLRAQICVNESAEEAARRQAALLNVETEAVRQRAAKDILDRAGVRPEKEQKTDITIAFAGGEIALGMPRHAEDEP